MWTAENKRALELRVSTLEQSLNTFHGSVRQYAEIVRHVVKEKAPDIPTEKKIVPDMSDSSLFEGLLQGFIRENNFVIDSGTEEETNYRIILENTPDSVIEMNRNGTILSINPSCTKSFGYREPEVLESNFFSLIPEEYHAGLKEGILRVLDHNFGKYDDTPDDIIVFRAKTKDGATVSMEGIFYAYSKNDWPILVLLIRDLTYSRSLFEELQETRDHYNALSETISETIIRIDEKFKIIFVNSAIQKTFGYQRDEIAGRHFSVLFPPGGFQRNEDLFRKYFIVDDQHRKELGMDVTMEILGKSKHRGLFPIEMSFGNSKEFNGRTMTCILRDITQRKHTERRLQHLAYHNKLTGLGNRDLFNNDIRSLLQSIKEEENSLSALMFLDLDGFKQVNDTLGHKAGDILLVETARRLRNNLRDTDSVYRFGGDEFVVLLNSIQKHDNASMVGSKLLGAVREPFLIDQGKDATMVNVGVSIGIAIIPMSKWIMETSCRTMHYLNTQGFPRLFTSVNVSPKQFDHPDFLDNTSNIIRRTGLNPENLKLELTETCLMTMPESAIEKMHALKKTYPGISIAIDDFGTGYSSLSYLSRFPADIIKIDLSFVIKLFQETNQKIVNAILNLAKSLNLQVVAEGVETEEQLQFFVAKECGMLQGYYFSEPLDLEGLRTILSGEKSI